MKYKPMLTKIGSQEDLEREDFIAKQTEILEENRSRL